MTRTKVRALGAAAVVLCGLMLATDAGAETLSPWPFTVDEVTLRCRQPTGAGWGMATATTSDGREFALNGTARSRYAPVDPIWAPNPAIRGTKIDIGPAINRALALCVAARRAAPPVRVTRR